MPGNPGFSRYTPLPPHPLNALTGAGSAKSVCKILMSKSLEVKILTTRELDPLPRHLSVPPPPRLSSARFATAARLHVTCDLWISRLAHASRQRRPEVGTHPYVELPSSDLPLPNLE